jgi:hypothetical protein
MISHQTKGMHLPARLLTRLLQGFQEQLPVGIRQKNRFPTIPTIHRMVNRPFVFNSQLARHAATLLTQKENTSIVIPLTP